MVCLNIILALTLEVHALGWRYSNNFPFRTPIECDVRLCEHHVIQRVSELRTADGVDGISMEYG